MQEALVVGIALTLWTPTWLGTPLTSYDTLRVAQVGLSALASLYVVIQLWVRRQRVGDTSSAGALLLAALLLLALSSALAAPHSAVSFQDLTLHLGLIALALAVAQMNSPISHRRLEHALAVTPIWLAGLTAVIYITALCMEQPLNARQLHLGVENPRYLNHAQTLFVPWLVVVYIKGESRKSLRAMAMAAAGFHVGLAYLDVARGTGLSWLAALAFLTVANARAEAKRFAAVLAGGLIFGVAAFDLLPALLSRQWDMPFARASEFGEAHSRDALWTQALAMLRSAPWLGSGPMEFSALASARAAHPHNIYLQWAAEYGIPAALLATALLAKPIVGALRATSADSRKIGLAAVCAACMVDGLVSGNFVMPLSQIWIACVYGQLLAHRGANRPSTNSMFVKRTTAACLLASQVWLFAVVLTQASSAEPHVPYPGHGEQKASPSKPRFWLHGQL